MKIFRFVTFIFFLCIAPNLTYADLISLSELPSSINSGEYLLQIDYGDSLTLSGTTTISGSATLQIMNYGTLNINNLTLLTYDAGSTSLENYGDFVANNIYIKDQGDVGLSSIYGTSIINHSSIEVNNLCMVANGSSGDINFETYDSSLINSIQLDANYGGIINISIHEGGKLVTSTFSSDASGISHGRESQINILQGEIEFAPVPEPATMLLLGIGLLGLAGVNTRKK